MRDNIEKLIALVVDGRVSTYAINKISGVPKTTIQRLKTGETEIDGISFKNAEKLSEYYKGLS